MLHAVADGHAFWHFMIDRDGVRHPKGDEEMDRMVLTLLAPAMPTVKVNIPPYLLTPRYVNNKTVNLRVLGSQLRYASTKEQCRRTFVLRADKILSLKQRIILTQSRADGEPSKPWSTYIALASMVRTSLHCSRTKQSRWGAIQAAEHLHRPRFRRVDVPGALQAHNA